MLRIFLIALLFALFSGGIFAQATTISFQGNLKSAGLPANGNYDISFDVYTALSGGTFLGGAIASNILVENGVYSAIVTFPISVWNGGLPRFVHIAVKQSSSQTWTSLTPRQQLAQAPFAVNAATFNGIAPSGFIQNTSSQQATTNFNIGGTGTASTFDAATQYNLAGQRILATPGSENLYAGIGAGAAHVSGIENSFFGRLAGEKNETGSGNSYFGFLAGRLYTTGSNNSIFGSRAGVGFFNGNGSFNSFFGHRAGEGNQSGNSNSFFGTGAGILNSTGGLNTFIGHDAGKTNSQGSLNTALGDSADVFPSNVTNATAIGANALAAQSNSLVLGSINGINGATADTNVGIGTSAPQSRLHVNAATEILSTGSGSGFKFRSRGSTSSNDDWVWYATGTDVNSRADLFKAGSGNLLTVFPSGVFRIPALAHGGSQSNLCAAFNGNVMHCQSSIRYKTNIAAFQSGLALIDRLRPVTFDWKENLSRDLGLVAEEVAEVEPLLVSRDQKGAVEGVKYDRVAVVLINAVKEQQAEIEFLKKKLSALTALICKTEPETDICREKEK